MKQKWKRPLALLLSVAMMFSMSGTPVYAADMETGASAVCPHHVHDETCGYSEGTPCTHEHTDDCYTLVTQCVHEHTAECYSDGILPAEGEEKAADACTHVCSEESGCITKELNCSHVHDETCGYSEGSPCTFDPADCELCNFQENPAEQTILSWEWIGADNLNEGVLPLPGVSAENPVDLATVVSMLPTGITATVDGSEEPVELTITWACEDFVSPATGGTYTFAAALPQSYTLSEETAALTVPVILGGDLLPVDTLATISWYGLSVADTKISGGGYWLNDPSTGGITNNGASASNYNVHFDANTYTLTLNNANLTKASMQGAIIVVFPMNTTDFTINLIGDNVLESSNIYGIYTKNTNMTITGSGSLTVSGSQYGIAEFDEQPANSTFTFTIAGGTVTATGGIAGTRLSSIGSIHNTLLLTGGSLTAEGGKYGIHMRGIHPEEEKTITVSSGGSLVASGDTYGIYFDAESSGDPAWRINVNSGGSLVTNSTSVTPAGSGGWLLYGGNTPTVNGTVALPMDLTISKGTALSIAKSSNFIIPDGVVLTNYGTIGNQGTISGNGQIINYGGINSFNGGTNNVANTVNRSVMTVTSKPNTRNIPYGISVTFTAALSRTDAGGMVRFKLDGEIVTEAVVSNGEASITLEGLEKGSHTVTAEYTGDGTYASETGSYQFQIVDGYTITMKTNGVGSIQPNDNTIQPVAENKYAYAAGERVNLRTNAPMGYEISYVTVETEDGRVITSNIVLSQVFFTMPAENVTVYASFAAEADVSAVNRAYSRIEFFVMKDLKISQEGLATQDEEAIEAWLEARMNSTVTDATVTCTAEVTSFTPAVAGTPNNPAGTNGSFSVDWSVRKGDAMKSGTSVGTITPAVFQAEISGIEIKTQPTKMDYSFGETLDLSGLVITVHYEGTDDTKEVAWSADSGITADPANGTALYASQHNGKPVTITYEGKTATTSALTVGKATPTVTDPTANTLTYTGAAQELVSGGGTTGGTMQYSLSEDGEYTEAIPTGIDAGQYTVYYKVVGNDDYNDVAAQSVSVTIVKANAQVTAAPQAVTGLTYTGNPQALVTAGSADGGTLVYSLDENGEYTDTIPTGTAAQSYTVWYKVQGNANYNDTEAQSVTAVIGNALAEVTILPTANTLTYTGSAQALVTAGEADGGEIQYSLSKDSGYSDTVPTATNAGDYTVWYKVVGDENHSDTQPVEVKVTIAKATPAYTVPTGLIATYGNTLNDVNLPDDWAWDDAVTTSVGNVGDNTFAAIFTPSDTTNYNTVTENLTVTVSARDITGADITLGDALAYTGQQQTQQIDSVTVGGLTVTYTVIGNTGTDAGAYTLTISGTGNFTGEATQEWSIAKATYTGATDVSGTVLANWLDKVTLPAIPAGASYGAASYGGTDGAVKDLSIEGSVLSYTGGSGVTKGREYKITVPVDGGKNYENYDITVTLIGTDKKVPTGAPTLSTATITYGQSLSTIALSGSMQDGAETVTGTFTWDAPTTTPDAGSYEAHWTFTPADGNLYVSVSGTTTITVNKATPTGTPRYTAITTSGKTLADANLTTEGGTFSVAGTVAWEQANTTQVQANTAYTWKFTPTDSDNYNSISGSITLYVVSSSGGGGSSGGGSSNTTTEITKNPDGSTTTTVTNKTTGTVTETTKNPDGSKEVVETKKDGTVTTTTTDTTGNKTQVVENTDGTKETTITNKDGSSSATTVDETGKTQAEVKLPAAVVEDAQGEAVTLPMPSVPVTSDRENAPTVTVDLPSGTSAKVEIPVAEVTPGTVAVIVKADGTEEVIKTSLTTENGVAVTLSDGDTVKVVDNSKTFDDVADNYWGAEAVDFTSSRELFAGTSATTFAPDTAMTRAMIVTVLARFEGVDTTTGDTWYEAGQQWAMQNGVSDGSNMDASLTREQLVTMFYRYAQSKGYDTTQGGMAIWEYADFEQISGYAAEAMTWAVNTGIINGTSTTTLSPQGEATRAQVATILMRFIEGMA